MTSNPYRTAGEPADDVLRLARERVACGPITDPENHALEFATALLALQEENERLSKANRNLLDEFLQAKGETDVQWPAIERLRSALKEALDLLDSIHEGEGYWPEHRPPRIAELRKEFGL